MKLDEVLGLWSDLYENVDTKPVEAVLGTYAVIYHENLWPAWTVAVAPSSSLKTELCRSLSKIPETVPRDDLTAAAFSSGRGQNKKEDLLDGLNNRVLVTKDFTTTLSKRIAIASELLGALRAIYDGEFNRQTSYGKNLWKGRFTFIAGCTSVIDGYQLVQSNLGERLLKVRFRDVEDDEDEISEAAAAAKNMGEESQQGIRDMIADETARLMEPLADAMREGTVHAAKLSNTQYHEIGEWASFTVRGRMHAERDYQHTPTDAPDRERPGRLSQQLTVVAQGIAALRTRHVGEREMALIRRVAFDCIPKGRTIVMRELLDGPRTVKDLHDLTGLHRTTLSRYILPDLEMARLVTCQDNPHKESYDLIPRWKRFFKEIYT